MQDDMAHTLINIKTSLIAIRREGVNIEHGGAKSNHSSIQWLECVSHVGNQRMIEDIFY